MSKSRAARQPRTDERVGRRVRLTILFGPGKRLAEQHTSFNESRFQQCPMRMSASIQRNRRTKSFGGARMTRSSTLRNAAVKRWAIHRRASEGDPDVRKPKAGPKC